MNKIIIWTSPTAPFQKIYVMKEGELVDQMGVLPNNLEGIVYALVDKYQIMDIDFSGTPSFAEGFMTTLRNNQIIHYGRECLNIGFVKG